MIAVYTHNIPTALRVQTGIDVYLEKAR